MLFCRVFYISLACEQAFELCRLSAPTTVLLYCAGALLGFFVRLLLDDQLQPSRACGRCAGFVFSLTAPFRGYANVLLLECSAAVGFSWFYLEPRRRVAAASSWWPLLVSHAELAHWRKKC